MAAVVEVLEVLEYFIGVCDDAKVNRRETLQSEEVFIMPIREHGLTIYAC